MSLFEIYLNDMAMMVKRIENQLKKGKIDFDKDVDSYDMLVLRLQVIGESIKKIPKKLLKKFPEVNWNIFINFRNISGHNYSAINKGIFTRILFKELPLLKKSLSKLKKELI